MSDDYIYPQGTTTKIDIPTEYNELIIGSSSARKNRKSFVEELFNFPESNIRFYNFAWLHLKFTKETNFDKENFGHTEQAIKDIGRFMRKLSEREEGRTASEIINLFHRRTAHPEHLDWMKQSRVMKWIKGKLPQFDQHDIQRLPNASGFIAIQSIFDYMDASAHTKLALLADLKTKWENNLKTDQELNWLIEEEEHIKRRRQLAWNYIIQNCQGLFRFDRIPSKHEDILEIFDQLTENGISKHSVIKKLKRHEGKEKSVAMGRKDKNLGILLENHKRLKELAAHWQLTERETMDRLIANGFEKELGKEASSED
ncbi:hypothetical protein [Pseudomonas sp. C11]|uniref:hypothetical protein n=1 Tax=Pseudomonas sp. C11 TaxID=3075550 RepID=UPI002AFFC606|nr:hypothetical protein [Pseudomonas sp. C11]